MEMPNLLGRRRQLGGTLAAIFIARRSMAGGPRTFKGGINKWEHKRMHEQLARDKQWKLLRQEKQIYLARLRTEIRSQTLGADSCAGANVRPSDFVPMSSREHIKAIADRFMKPGAEDLWNEYDGPISEAPSSPTRNFVIENAAKGRDSGS